MTDASGEPLHVVERRLLGVDHAEVGAMLAQHWQFSTALISCIRMHQTTPEADALTSCVAMVNQWARRAGVGNARNAFQPHERPVTTRWGSDFATIEANLGALDSLFVSARAFSASAP
jgi:HD-like signal output (HDOD) protein